MNKSELILYLSEVCGIPIEELKHLGIRDLYQIVEEAGIEQSLFDNNPYIYDEVHI